MASLEHKLENRLTMKDLNKLQRGFMVNKQLELSPFDNFHIRSIPPINLLTCSYTGILEIFV